MEDEKTKLKEGDTSKTTTQTELSEISEHNKLCNRLDKSNTSLEGGQGSTIRRRYNRSERKRKKPSFLTKKLDQMTGLNREAKICIAALLLLLVISVVFRVMQYTINLIFILLMMTLVFATGSPQKIYYKFFCRNKEIYIE